MRFLAGTFATWRLAHLLAVEDGPGEIVLRLRIRAGESSLGELMDCFNCLSLWVAGPVSLVVARSRRELAVTWLALSGAACLLERVTPEVTRRAA